MNNEQIEQVREALEAKRRRAVERVMRCIETEEGDLEYNEGLAAAYGVALSLLDL